MAKVAVNEMEDLAGFAGGVVRLLFKRELENALADLMDRPRLDKPREITVVLGMSPVCDDSGALLSVNTQVKVAGKVPPAKTPSVSVRITGKKGRGEGFVYNDLSPDNVDQMTLPLDEGNKDQQKAR